MLRTIARSWVWLLSVGAVLSPFNAQAACNLIPAAERTFPSTLGSVQSAVTAPGKIVEIHLNTACDASPGFDTAIPANNVVTLTFEPPNAGSTDVAIAPGAVTVLTPSVLRFVLPDTDADLSPSGDGLGLTGPARIRVRRPDTTLLAEIGPLFEPTATCDRAPEGIFHQFTVLPPPNVFSDLLSGATTRVLATVDGDGDLLVPFHYVAVLPAGIGAPIARLLEGQSGIEAFSGGGMPVDIPSPDYVRSFTLDGRPLPPLLRVNDTGSVLFGTADAAESVLRIARTDGVNPPIYDFTDRLFAGKGPIVVDKFIDGFTVTSGEAVPLRGLRSSAQTVAFARDEAIEGDLNGDGDTGDRIVQLIDVQTAVRVNPTRPLVEVTRADFSGLALETSGSLLAFLQSEAHTQTVLNGDGDRLDSVLRVYTATGTHLTSALNVTADPTPAVNGRSLVVSGSLVFFRTREGDEAARTTSRASVAGVDSDGPSFESALSADGHLVAFSSSATNLVPADGNARDDIFVRDRVGNTIERVSVDSNGVETGADSFGPAINDDGGYVAFASNSATLVPGDLNGRTDIFLRDRTAGTTERVSIGAGGEGNDDSNGPALDADADVVAFHSFASNLVAGDSNLKQDVFVRDRIGNGTELVSVDDNGVQGNDHSYGAALSDDGRFVAFVSLASNLVPGDAAGHFDAFVHDRLLHTTERVSVGLAGAEPDDDTLSVSISGDGRFVAFESFASNLVPNDGDLVHHADVFVIDRVLQTTERISENTNGEGGDDDSIAPKISADGRFVAFHSFASNLIENDLNATPDAFLFDRDTNTLERASVSTAGVEGTGFSTTTAISADGQHVAYTSDAANLAAGDGNGTQDVFVRGIALSGGLTPDGDTTDTVLQVFDTAGSALRPAARAPATTVAVASERAAIITAEADAGGADLNGDGGDPTDLVAQLYDGPSDTLVPLGRAANRVAISDQLVAVTTPEEQEFGVDANGDGDPFDDVLAVHPIGNPPPAQNVGLAADAIAITGTTVALITSEASEANEDLNGDGDAADRVLRTYLWPGGQVTNVGEAAEEMVVGGNLVAFRTSEAAQGNRDLDGDGDALDWVMQVYDLSTGTLISTGQAAILCTLPGCEPFTPYKVKGENVSFLTREQDQGDTDLNGDGDALDTVAQIFGVRTGTTQIFDLSANQPDLPPFPDDSFDGDILYVQGSEPAEGRDLNGDGDQGDLVVLLAADSDGDGTFDDHDTCAESANPEQDDSDLDGLGDQCDPTAFCGVFVPSAPTAAPPAAHECQKAAGKAAAVYLKKRTAAVTTCLGRIAAGRLSGEPSATCRGSFIGAVEVLPVDGRTATKLRKAAEKFADALGKKCSVPALAQLDACGSTLDDVAACARAAYGAGGNAIARLAFGDVQPAPDGPTRACQTGVGKASGGYLRSVVKSMQGCLDRLAAGEISGDPQAVCLGSLGVGGVALPTDSDTGTQIIQAETKLRSIVAAKCPGGILAALDACAGDPGGVGDCLECTGWRRAVEAMQSLYGPE